MVERLAALALCALLLAGCTAGTDRAGAPDGSELSSDPAVQAEELAPTEGPAPAEDLPRATVIVYMIGSDLESDEGLATLDLEEMQRADLGERVTLVIQTMGSRAWHNEEVSPASAQRFTVEDGALVCQAEDLGQLDSTDPATLRDLITWCAERYPAQRNILIFWDHGGGPVYGFGYDELRPSRSSLTLDEIQSALEQAGTRFDFIGFDACLMGCLETGCALQDHADYLIASEDFVSGYGWEYQYWLTELGDDPAMDTRALGRTIIDTYVTESEQAGDPGILSLIDLSAMPRLFSSWARFAYAHENALTGVNWSWPTEITRRSFFSDWTEDSREEVMQDYYISDMMAMAATLGGPGSLELMGALERAVVCSASTAGDSACTGLAVTLPYGDPDFYRALSGTFLRCGLDSGYVAWLSCFAQAEGAEVFYAHWSDWSERWDNSTAYGGWASRRLSAPRAGA